MSHPDTDDAARSDTATPRNRSLRRLLVGVLGAVSALVAGALFWATYRRLSQSRSEDDRPPGD